jgi:hypothetical protein
MYDKGIGVPKDDMQAAEWYRKAAEQGLPEGQLNLGDIYTSGEGIPQDYIEAYKWFTLAASLFAASDTENHGNAVRNRDLIAAKMTAGQIAEARRRAQEWKPK